MLAYILEIADEISGAGRPTILAQDVPTVAIWMGQKGTCVTIRTSARYKSETVRKTHPKRNFVLFRNRRGLISSWSA